MIDHGRTFILGEPVSGAVALDAAGERAVVDLIRIRPSLRSGGIYQGLCW